ncbi:glycosyltransferase family 2 protein [Macrococcus animalis]|uniref:glycosyltransferase family 2 protein n=1 Tax=Macrococcus animalis TaxID=3395467 RepID=UPI0039BEADA9
MISVCMATYNGEVYIKKQLESILNQLNENDELIICDDQSSDETTKIISSINDSRIKLYVNEVNLGVVKTFEKALNYCNGDYIYLSDQDDIWYKNKVEKYQSQFNNGAVLVMANQDIIDENDTLTGQTFFDIRKTRTGFLKNLIKNTYIGCSIAFKKDLLKVILPFPSTLPMHDSWIGLNAERYGKVILIDEPLMGYRRHSNNVTQLKSSRSIPVQITDRINLISNLVKRRVK